MMTIISLGAGVQSTTMLLMASRGELSPMPQAAIFADTQAEPPSVYRHLDYLRGLGLPIPIHVVTAGSLLDAIGSPGGRRPKIPVPAWFRMANGKSAGLNRSCTETYKIVPIRKKARELAGITGKRSPKTPVVEQWIGISVDEAHRMKDSGEPWRLNRWPLIEKKMTRSMCLDWLLRNGYRQPPKSACTFCPYHNTAGWRAVRSEPEAWRQALAVDNRLRGMWSDRLDNPSLYLHWSMRPLEDATADPDSDRQMDLWGSECAGVCGL